MQSPIEQLLIQDYDQLKRDTNGSVVYEKRLTQVADNLLCHPALDSSEYQTYDAFMNALLCKAANSNIRIYTIPNNNEKKYRYVGDVLTRQIWSSWMPSDNVYISAGTGRGKNTFIKMELLKHIGDAKVVIFENRESLMQQQIMDMVSEIDPDALQYQGSSEENMVVFGSTQNIMLISYQSAAMKCALGDSRFLSFCQAARYLVFDEAHYILDDANFNKGINFFLNAFLPQNAFPNATKIFMSGSMEEFYTFSQIQSPFMYEPIDICNEKENRETNLQHPQTDANGMSGYLDAMNEEILNQTKQYKYLNQNGMSFGTGITKNKVLSLPTDYSYIIPYRYKFLEDITSQIAQSAVDEKWVIFVKSIEEGVRLQSSLKSVCGDSVYFLDAENKRSSENKELYQGLVKNCSFDCRVLIATTVIYNGINVKDSQVKHIVVPFTTVSVMKQLIGRKRMEEGESVKVYFPVVSYQNIKRTFMKRLGEYFELMELRAPVSLKPMLQTNHLLSEKTSKFYYMQQLRNPNGTWTDMLRPCLNEPAIHKLFYDSCFYIFTLQRMRPELEEAAQDYPSVMMQHLGIADTVQTVDVSEQTIENKWDTIRKELADYLEKLAGTTIVSPDESGSYDTLLDLKRMLNDAHRALHDGTNLDTHWKRPERFFSADKVKDLLNELSLPYQIKSESENKVRITVVTKQE